MSGLFSGREDSGLQATLAAGVSVQAAQGILDVCLPLRAQMLGISADMFGWTGAAHACGFLLGATAAPHIQARWGGFVGLVIACVLGMPLLFLCETAEPLAWLSARLGAGAAFALMFAITETWIVETSTPAFRPRAISLFSMLERLASALAPFALAGRLTSRLALVGAVGFFWGALLAGTALRNGPGSANLEPARLTDAWAISPSAMVAGFGAGALNTVILAILPRYLHSTMSEGSIAAIQASAWAGALLVQLFAGFVASSGLRRSLGRWIGLLAAMALVCLPFVRGNSPVVAAALFVWGAGGLSQYGLAAMALADAAHRNDRPSPAAALVLAWSLGAITGPAVAASSHLFASPGLLFPAAAACWAGLAVAAMTVSQDHRPLVLPECVRRVLDLRRRLERRGRAVDLR
jgi:MFS family permease